MDARVGAAEFDALGQSVCVGWCEFDATAAFDCRVGWVEFDCLAPMQITPPFYPGGGQSRYHDYSEKQYEMSLAIDEDDEEIVLIALMELAQNVL